MNEDLETLVQIMDKAEKMSEQVNNKDTSNQVTILIDLGKKISDLGIVHDA